MFKRTSLANMKIILETRTHLSCFCVFQFNFKNFLFSKLVIFVQHLNTFLQYETRWLLSYLGFGNKEAWEDVQPEFILAVESNLVPRYGLPIRGNICNHYGFLIYAVGCDYHGDKHFPQLKLDETHPARQHVT